MLKQCTDIPVAESFPMIIHDFHSDKPKMTDPSKPNKYQLVDDCLKHLKPNSIVKSPGTSQET